MKTTDTISTHQTVKSSKILQYVLVGKASGKVSYLADMPNGTTAREKN